MWATGPDTSVKEALHKSPLVSFREIDDHCRRHGYVRKVVLHSRTGKMIEVYAGR